MSFKLLDDLLPKTIHSVLRNNDQGEGSTFRLFGALWVNTATIQPACSTSPANHPAATACFTQCFIQEHRTVPWVHFQHKWPQWELSSSPAQHQCHDRPKHHSLLVTRRQKKGLAHIVWFAVQQHEWLTSLHPACWGPSQPTTTSDTVAEKQLGLFSHWHICLTWGG